MRINRRVWWFTILLVFIAYALRMITVVHVGLEVDEPINYAVSISAQAVGFPSIREELGQNLTLYFAHPPFGYVFVAYWFDLVGNSMYAARVLSVLMSTLALVVLASFVRRKVGHVAGLFTLLLLGVDNWLVMTNSMFYLENFQLILCVAALWVYWKALSSKRERLVLYVLAGVLVGSVFVYKHVGVYFVFGVIAAWVALRRHNRGHLVLLTLALATVVAYGACMYLRWGNLWWDPTWHQFERTFGRAEARGLNYGLDTMLEVILDRYWIFAATILGMGAGALGTILCYIGYLLKKIHLSKATAVVVFWGIGAIVFGGGTALRSPHYFMLWLLPFLALTAIGFCKMHDILPKVVIGILVLMIVLNALSFVWRIVVPHDDVLASAAQYVSGGLPDDAVVATEPYIAMLFDQRYVRYDQVDLRELLDTGTTHMVLYWTTTAAIPEELGDRDLVSFYCPVISEEFVGFKDHAVICVINRENLRSLVNP